MLPSVLLHPDISVFLCKAYFCRHYFPEIYKPKIGDFTHFEKIVWSPNDVVSGCCILLQGYLKIQYKVTSVYDCRLPLWCK
jgi:hypothetical protein